MALVLGTTLFGLLFGSVYGQYEEAECNFYYLYPLDVCIAYSTYDDYLMCNGTDMIVRMTYTSGECGTTNAVAISSTTYATGQFGVCDQSSSCGYFIQTCDNIAIVADYMGACISTTSGSYMESCKSNSAIVTTTYYEKDDCSGKSTLETEVDYSANEASYTECTVCIIFFFFLFIIFLLFLFFYSKVVFDILSIHNIVYTCVYTHAKAHNFLFVC